MTERFHFDVESGDEVIRDESGVEAGDLSQAIKLGLQVVEEVRSAGELAGAADWELVIRDEDGSELYRTPIDPRCRPRFDQ